MRKTPKMPPPRQATPKHTNIGSPKRMSSTRAQTRAGSTPTGEPGRSQPGPNRVLDFAPSKVIKSIEASSPFKPRKNLRRSLNPARPNPFASPAQPVDTMIGAIEEDENEDEDEEAGDSEPIISGALPEDLDEDPIPATGTPIHPGDVGDDYVIVPDESIPDLAAAVGDTIAQLPSVSAPSSPWQSRSRKRGRTSDESRHAAEVSLSQSQVNMDQPEGRRSSGRLSQSPALQEEDWERTIDPVLLQADDNVRVEDDPMPAAKKSKGKSKVGKHTTTGLNDVDRPSKLTQRQSQSREPSLGARTGQRGSIGPSSNFQLRATTPFEDAGGRVSRFGRTLIEPLKYWANETKVWKHGEVDSIVRADEVPEKSKSKPKKKKKKREHKSKKSTGLDDVEGNSETESCQADAWEDEVGVIAGDVASWDAEEQAGDVDHPIREGMSCPCCQYSHNPLTNPADLAFAAAALVTRDVAGSDFRYAKILTSGFFGSGVVEIPPSGFKSMKNSRRMEMVFFVAEGKVVVEVGTQETGPNEFAISKGGCWVVPRGEFHLALLSNSSNLAKRP